MNVNEFIDKFKIVILVVTIFITLLIVTIYYYMNSSICSRGGPNLSIDLGNGIILEMVKIPAGTFQMGSPDNEPHRISNESPLHTVKITKDFYLGKYEVTQAQWKKIMGNDDSKFKTGQNGISSATNTDNYPVDNVSFIDIFGKDGFLTKINLLKPCGYNTFRLPREAEWEYACRGGTTTMYYWGDNQNSIGDYEWYEGNSTKTTHPVGQKKPNPFKLYDMSGNVMEWCIDFFQSYSLHNINDPVGIVSDLGEGMNKDSQHVLRGGLWCDNIEYFRSAKRSCSAPWSKGEGLYGFRLVLQ